MYIALGDMNLSKILMTVLSTNVTGFAKTVPNDTKIEIPFIMTARLQHHTDTPLTGL